MTGSKCNGCLGVPWLGRARASAGPPLQPIVPALHVVPRKPHAEHVGLHDAHYALTMKPALDEDGAAAGSAAAEALQEQLEEQQREFNDLLACLGQESAKVPSGAFLFRPGARPWSR